MTDTVQINTLYDGPKRRVLQLINTSDGTGESAVIKSNISDDTANNNPHIGSPAKYSIQEVEWTVQGFASIAINFDATTDDEGLLLGVGSGYKDLRAVGGIMDPQSTGYTGDIVLTTNSATSGDTYDIIIHLRKYYD